MSLVNPVLPVLLALLVLPDLPVNRWVTMLLLWLPSLVKAKLRVLLIQ